MLLSDWSILNNKFLEPFDLAVVGGGAAGFMTAITAVIWVLLWFGYRQNKINDEIKKKEKEERINAKIQRRKKLESLYPTNKKTV